MDEYRRQLRIAEAAFVKAIRARPTTFHHGIMPLITGVREIIATLPADETDPQGPRHDGNEPPDADDT